MEKEKRYFEWIDGEDKGTVLTLDYIEVDTDDIGKPMETYVFTNGDSCNKEFISPMAKFAGELTSTKPDGTKGSPKFMVEVSSPTNVWTFAEITGKTVDVGVINGSDTGKRNVPALEDIMTFDTGKRKKSFNLVAPKQDVHLRPLPLATEYQRVEEHHNIEEPQKEMAKEEPVLQGTVHEVEPVSAPVNSLDSHSINFEMDAPKVSEDPVSILVSTSKKEEKDVEMTITLSLPSKELFAIASNNFEDGETKFIDNIVKDLDISEIISAIRLTLLESYRASISKPNP